MKPTERIHISPQKFRPIRQLGPEKILVISFAAYIILVSLLLTIPQATTGGSMDFIDALFTITSATCVTGLTVVDTGTYFTGLGQVIVLLSIQLGGIGIMTFSTFLLYIFGRRLTSRDASLLSASHGSTNAENARGLLITVVLVTFLIEAVGAFFLFSRFEQDLPPGEALWSAVFHSISAFCNAGFSLFPDNLMGYVGNGVVNATIMILIFLGGIGFMAFLELWQFGRSRIRLFLERVGIIKGSTYWRAAPYRFSVHTRIVVVTSFWLILIGAVIIGFLEFNNVQKDMPWTTRIYSSLFQSVTPRTAGYNTVNIGAMSGASLFAIIILMFIGASPGSTGGGIKTSTFAVLLGIARTRLRRDDEVLFFDRRISSFVQSEAVTFMILAMGTVLFGALLMQIFETGGSAYGATGGKFLALLFETVSAFATVGLSTGITPHLAPLSKLTLIILMFVGRVGPLTLALALSRKNQASRLVHPEGRVIIG